MSMDRNARRRAILAAVAGMSLAAVSSAASACDCYGGYGYYRGDDRGSAIYSCYGGGYDCRYESRYYRPIYHRRYGGYYGYYGHRAYDGYRYRDCDRDCR
jgi:hypothetical protein